MASPERKAAPYASDHEVGVVPAEITFGKTTKNPYAPVDKGVPWAKQDENGKVESASGNNTYGARAHEAVYSGKAGPKLGDSEGGTPWATEYNNKPVAASPPKKRDTCPFATDY
eukprot:m.169324 g.169324  ORF g.169324 m.169324 type:complete len:114 (+) comp18242_c0_seq1:2416-2757(+)